MECYTLATPGYHDWYLPATYEASVMNYAIGFGAEHEHYNLGGFQLGYYWTCGQLSDDLGIAANLANLDTDPFQKFWLYKVSPIRYFTF
ncbi:MAG: hypothetical protein ACI837_001151 [Crocinitomicaceae bacterium]|jgi:hypothetical protein